MNNSIFFEELTDKFQKELTILIDKPEETPETTLKALWLKACGINVSAEKAAEDELPELINGQVEKLNDLVSQRLNKIPLAHLTGRQSFMGIEFMVDNRALIPRKETEVLGNTALQLSQNSYSKDPIKVIDICCGCGNLGLAMAKHNSRVQAVASDISQEAIDLANENAEFLELTDRVKFVQGDMFIPFESDEYLKNTDMIICNPPYISSAKVKQMNREISENEPALAFDGGALGFKIIQELIAEAPRFLRAGGWLVFEVGLGQGEFVMQRCYKTQRFTSIMPVKDNKGNIRCIAVQK